MKKKSSRRVGFPTGRPGELMKNLDTPRKTDRVGRFTGMLLIECKSQWVGASIPSLCHGIFTDWSIFTVPFLLWQKGSSGPVTQWRQLVSCDWSWHSHGSLILGKFDLKINWSTKTSWQECCVVARSYSSASVDCYSRHI